MSADPSVRHPAVHGAVPLLRDGRHLSADHDSLGHQDSPVGRLAPASAAPCNLSLAGAPAGRGDGAGQHVSPPGAAASRLEGRSADPAQRTFKKLKQE